MPWACAAPANSGYCAPAVSMSSRRTTRLWRQLSRQGPLPELYCASSISGACSSVKTPVVGFPFSPSMLMPAMVAAGRASV